MPRPVCQAIGFSAAIALVGCSRTPAPAPVPAPPAANTTPTTPVTDEESVDAPEPVMPIDTTVETEDSGDTDETLAGFESPEAAFAAAQLAVTEEDWRGVVDCMTPEAQEVLVSVISIAAVFGGDQAVALVAVFEEHGVEVPSPELAFAAVGDGTEPGADNPGPPTLEVDDRAAFLADLIGAMAESGLGAGQGGPQEWARAELTELQTDDDRASGILIVPIPTGQRSEPIAFTRTGDGWLIDVGEMAPGGLPAP